MWIGINDCQQGQDEQAQLTQFFQLQEKLYKHGARNFVFLNVPPFDRSPACTFPPFALSVNLLPRTLPP